MTCAHPVLRFRPRFLVALALAAFFGPSQSWALECPEPQKLSRPGILKETPTQIAVVSAFLANGKANKTVPLLEADLRARYPGVENAEIINYIVTAYCPVVNDMKGSSDAMKKARMNRFVHDLMQMTY